MNNLPDITPIEQSVQVNVPVLLDHANALDVWDDDSVAKGTDIGKTISECIRLAEEERKSITRPMAEATKKINARFKQYTDPLNEALAVVKGKILRYKQEQLKIAAAQAEAARKAAEAAAVPAPISANSVTVAPSRGDFGSASMRKTWVYELVDISLVPPQYLCLDVRAVKQAISEGVRDIAGVKIYQEESVMIR